MIGNIDKMVSYLKRHEKEWKKKAEKEAEIRRRKEEEENERKRQEKKLNFLLKQTELYAHFMAKKLSTSHYFSHRL
jgi:DNA helicase INO80